MAYDSKKIKSNIGTFLKQYKRKSDKNIDPNDRSYDRNLEEIIKKMKPDELFCLMYDGDDDFVDAPDDDFVDSSDVLAKIRALPRD